MALPAVEERGAAGLPRWTVKGKLMTWDRPLRKSDLAALELAANDDPVLGVRVPDESDKLALVASDARVYFTTPHFDGYPMVLVWLDAIGVDELEELIVEAWLTQAPKRLAAAYLADRA